jgi:hypothetical protein
MKFKKWSVLLLILVLVSLTRYGQTSPLTKSQPDQDGYYPLDLGGKWTFQLKEKNQLKTAVVTCDKTGRVNNLDCIH